MEMKITLEDKYAVVCGSTQGIGLAIAQALAGLGATCVLLARNEDRLRHVVATLPNSHRQRHHYEVADFADLENVLRAIERIRNNYPIEILINNTGGPDPGPLTGATVSGFELAFRQHLLCNQLLVNTVLPFMMSKGYGRIINIISTSVKTPLPNLGISNTIRGAVAAWAKTLANEVGEYGITVNNILPGSIQTARLIQLLERTAVLQDKSLAEVTKEMEQAIPLKRIGQPEEVANVAVFLASPAASYVTGTSIRVDGGKTPVI